MACGGLLIDENLQAASKHKHNIDRVETCVMSHSGCRSPKSLGILQRDGSEIET